MILPAYNWNELDNATRGALLQRPAMRDDAQIRTRVAAILSAIRHEGDAALRRFTMEIDGVSLDDFRVREAESLAAERCLDAGAHAAIDTAITNVRRFHAIQVPAPLDIETMPGVRCERRSHPIDAVGLYVPAGTAPLPSAAIMLGVPAALAECPVAVMCTPPRTDGTADPAVVVAANRAGVTDIYKVGGAQAIAAMAYGTESVPKVRKIFGPGNAWVTSAKSLVSADPGGAAIDMPAGPSELLVIADSNADLAFVASDLLSQAEHGIDSQVLLVTTSTELVRATAAEIERQLGALRRAEIARQALANSRAIIVADLAEAIAVSNQYAPEHLILQVDNARGLLGEVRNAGSVFLGPWTPESVGDYCSGTNHVLPTYGYASTYSGLGVDQFMRQMTIQELSREGLASLGDTVLALASLEGLDAHAAAVSRRLGARS